MYCKCYNIYSWNNNLIRVKDSASKHPDLSLCQATNRHIAKDKVRNVFHIISNYLCWPDEDIQNDQLYNEKTCVMYSIDSCINQHSLTCMIPAVNVLPPKPGKVTFKSYLFDWCNMPPKCKGLSQLRLTWPWNERNISYSINNEEWFTLYRYRFGRKWSKYSQD